MSARIQNPLLPIFNIVSNALAACPCHAEDFVVASAGLTGTIPTWFGNFTSLGKFLHPASLKKCLVRSCLVLTSGCRLSPASLNLNSNNLMGTIPSEIGFLTKLTKLWFNVNRGLSGTIPKELGLLTALTSLELQETKLAGSMPSQICDLNLTDLWAACGAGGPVTCECCTTCTGK